MSIKISEELKNDFLIYAQEVNQNRSFCDCRDGLKPSQRAALYTMFRKGFSSNKPHVKSAKITGAIIGELWPHGDSSAYESIVRMSQSWINNIAEVDWHGANGSLQGGPSAASSRYTEARLSTAAEDEFFYNIKKNVVDMIPNFSEDDEWPSVFPALSPRLLINGSQGIGYTIAQEWEPHNLIEVVEKVKEYLKTGKVNCDNIFPDFPTGGIIINKKDLHNIYETGRGQVILRGKAEMEGNIIKITELPYQVYAEPFIQKVKDLVNSETITGIEDICNKSDDNGLCIEIECKGDKIDAGIVLNKLYKYTDMQVIFNANQMALVNGVPQMLNLQEYLKVYIDHNITCIQREYKFDLEKAEARLEIVDGLLKAIKIIDKIIPVIRSSKSSESARQDLMDKFKFTENQAKAIVDMRLGKLANLESVELVKEQEELNETVEKCNSMLASEKLQQKEFLKRLTEFTKKYGWERRTEVTDIDIEEEKKEIKARATKSEEMFNIVLTTDGHLKKLISGKVKSNNSIKSIIQVFAKDKFIAIGKNGKMYKIACKDIKLASIGSVGQNDLIDTEIIEIFTGRETDDFMFLLTSAGKGLKTKLQPVFELSKNSGAPIIKTDADVIFCAIGTDKSTINIDTDLNTKSFKLATILDKGRNGQGIQVVKFSKKCTKITGANIE